jgi:hypothetical protein
MASVERIAYRWADVISVERNGDALLVRGQGPVLLDIRKDTPSADALLEYARFAQNSKPIPGQLRGGRLAPHVQFANAETDEDLIASFAIMAQ